jgi:hypothetical protein
MNEIFEKIIFFILVKGFSCLSCHKDYKRIYITDYKRYKTRYGKRYREINYIQGAGGGAWQKTSER